MAAPPRIHDEDTSPGNAPPRAGPRPAPPSSALLDDALGFMPLDEARDDEPTVVPVAETRAGPGPEPRPVTGETRRPTDRGVVPPPLPRTPADGTRPPPMPRASAPPLEAETVAPLRANAEARGLIKSGLFRPVPIAAPPLSSAERTNTSRAAVPDDRTAPERAALTAMTPRRVLPQEDAQVHVRSAFLKKRSLGKGGTVPAAPRLPERGPVSRPESPRVTPPPPLSRPSPRPVIRSGREPKSLTQDVSSSSLLSRPIVRPSGKNLVPPAQREPTDPSAPTSEKTDEMAPWASSPGAASKKPQQTDTGAEPRDLFAPWDGAPRGPAMRDASPPSALVQRDIARGPTTDSVARPRVERVLRERTDTATASPGARRVTTWFRPLSWVTLGLLLLVVVLPSDHGAPWELMLRPSEPTFIALAALVLVAVVHALPLGARTRSIFALATAVLLLALALATLGATVAVGFDLQPALVTLFSGEPSIGAALVVAATLVPAGLLLRTLDSRHLAATGLVGFGAALVLAAALGVGNIFPDAPVVLLVDGLGDASMLGDRVASAAALPAVALLAGSLAFTFPGLGRRLGAPLAVVMWALSFLPMLLLAMFAASSDHALVVLGAVKVVLLLAASALYLASSLAHVFLPNAPSPSQRYAI